MEINEREDWLPERGQIIWINCNPQAGREMRVHHPLLVLSPAPINQRTSLVIGLPMTTADDNADNPFAVVVGRTITHEKEVFSYVLCHQPKSFDWRARGGRPHPQGWVGKSVLLEVCSRLNQIIQLDQ